MIRLAAIVAGAVMLSGCITLFPESEPARQYVLDLPAPELADKAFDVARGPIAFTRAGAGDGILTVENGQASYIDGARWVVPARQMFEEQVHIAFRAGPARLTPRGAAGQAKWFLRLDVTQFEVDYRAGAPIVVVEIKAILTRNTRDGQTSEEIFRAEAPAGSNNVGAIVAAYEQALGKTLGDLVGWVSTVGAGP
jgi:cholesterol transport system auxiliary component